MTARGTSNQICYLKLHIGNNQIRNTVNHQTIDQEDHES